MKFLKMNWIILLLITILLSFPCMSFSKRTPAPYKNYPETCKGDFDFCFDNAMAWCTNNYDDCDNLSGSEKKYCQSHWMKNCEAAIQHCEDNYQLCTYMYENKAVQDSSSSENSSRMLRDQPCPPGTSPTPLGVCKAVLKASEETPDVYPNDGCPSGTIRGPKDDCQPIFFTVFVAQFREGRFVVCPSGTKPGPLGNCILDLEKLGKPEDNDSQQSRSCPPGTVLGPRGACIPTFNNVGQANYLGLMMLDYMARAELIDPGNYSKTKIFLNDIGVALAEEVEAAVHRTAETLRAQPQ